MEKINKNILNITNKSSNTKKINIYHDGTSGNIFCTDGATNQNINLNNALYTIGATNYVGIGKTNPGYPLDIVAGNNYNWVNSGYYFTYYVGGTLAYAPAAGSASINNSILAAGGITSNMGFYATSDNRIKNIIEQPIDVSIIDLIKPVQFTYKDIVKNGPTLKLGFIAQNIKEYIPGATTIRKDTIPDIFKKCNIIYSDNKIMIELPNHNLNIGDNIKVILNERDMIGIVVPIHNVLNNDLFELSSDELKLDETQKELFIYGREVDDLLDVDYNSISTLTFAGVKDLRTKYSDLNAKYSDLNAKYSDLVQKINLLNTDIR